MKHLPIIIGAAAIGAVVVLQYDCSGKPLSGRASGKANDAAAAALRSRASWFEVPSNNSMLCAYRSMRDAIGKRTLTTDELVALCDAWLAAYNAGCNASKTNAATDSLYEETAVNYSMVKLPLPASCAPSSWGKAPCTDAADWKAARTPMGNVVCALLQQRDALSKTSVWGDDEAPANTVLARIQDLATRMDAGDFLRDGEREFDKLPRVADLPSKMLGGLLHVIDELGMTVVVLLVGGVVLWRVAR